MTTRDLEGRRIVVTGASRGIGRTIAHEVARRGAKVALLARNEADLAAVASEIESETGRSAVAVRCDITDANEVKAALQRALSAMGGVDGLVNNAGVQGSFATFADTSPDEFRRVVEVNLFGAIEVVRAVLPALLAGGTGSIVNIASMAGKMGVPAWSAYCSAKHGLLGFTKTLALEVATSGVTCNAVCPGFVRTDMMSDATLQTWGETLGLSRREIVKEVIVKRTPQARFVEAQSIAAATVFLLSSAAADITGQSLNVSCGIGDY
jgi:3-hydroxybutyrate dehydrogenase